IRVKNFRGNLSRVRRAIETSREGFALAVEWSRETGARQSLTPSQRSCARHSPMPTTRHFVTDIYRDAIGSAELNADLLDAAKMLAKEDKAGRAWCREHGYQGYTSYSSLDDLPQRATCFDQLVRVMKPHVEAFASGLQMDLRGKRLKLDNI